MNKNIENIIEFNYSNGESLYTNIDNVRIEMANGYVSKLTIIDITQVKYLYNIKNTPIKTQLQNKNLVSITRYVPVKHESYNTIAVPLPINYVAADPEDPTESFNICQSYVTYYDKITMFFDTYTMKSKTIYENNQCKHYLNVYNSGDFNICYKKDLHLKKYIINDMEVKNVTSKI